MTATESVAPALDTTGVPRRVRELDVLRGFALLGILLANVQVMADPYAGSGGDPFASPVDRAAAWMVTALVAMKFYPLFSFLFGYSLTLQMSAAERERAAFARRHLRRLTGLFLLGLAHAVLLFVGDILMAYAVLGLVLFGVRNVAPRTAVRAALCLLAVLSAAFIGVGLLQLADEPTPTRELVTEAAQHVAAYRGDPFAVIHANLEQLPEMVVGTLIMGADLMAAFLIGLAAGKRQVLAGSDRYRGSMVRIAKYGLAVGLPGSVFMAVCLNGPMDDRWSYIGTAAGMLTGPALTSAYACGLVLFLNTARGRWVGAALAPAGRMALTSYLTQSLVMAFAFTGYGLALYDRVGTVALLAGCVVFYAIQLALSAWLMRRFRYGPVEWLLRAITLARIPSPP
ncbi:DUF418 domain-containing protein [Streptomyces sp. 8N616]|uniref:DUF418 domain-containing protein n=1 Tax=Streptomyces sp. 8N616 TaxID=3457414 RepID=UPI003FD4C9B2